MFPDSNGYSVHSGARVVAKVKNGESMIAGQAQANAHLIASAPELLSELDACAASISYVLNRIDLTVTQSESLRQRLYAARAAIAKATGAS